MRRPAPVPGRLLARIVQGLTSVRARAARNGLRTLLLSAALLATLVPACATLPDLSYLDQAPSPAAPTVVGAGGSKMPDGRGASLLAQRLHNSRTDLKQLAALEEAATGSPLVAGNKVTLLFDGPKTMAAMMDAIRRARDHINLETYIFDQDSLGQQFANLLIEKQRAGVQVNIIYDSVGTFGTPAAFFERMRQAGIQLVEFNPVNPLKAAAGWRLNNRDHRKILVVDGKIGFTGGVNIAADYAFSSLFRSEGERNRILGWRDTHVQLQGPAVANLQLLFLQTWAARSSQPLPNLNWFPPLPVAGPELVRVIGSQPGGNFEIYKAYYLALAEAKKSVHLTMAYFAPDRGVLNAILGAARRGVDVHMIFPGVSDAPLVYYAARSYYQELLDAGVKISEFQDSVLHAKTAVIDGVWSTVGSANVDIRSFLHNTEVNLVVLGADFGRAMEAAFQEDLRNSKPIDRKAWGDRSLFDKLRESSARQLAYFL